MAAVGCVIIGGVIEQFVDEQSHGHLVAIELFRDFEVDIHAERSGYIAPQRGVAVAYECRQQTVGSRFGRERVRDEILVESGKLGKFDPQCVGSIVRVKGILREQRVDEDYLRSWEEQVRTQAGEQHGTTAAGCDSEKKARGETAATVEGRIADFRRKIAERNAAEGKPYLSFYFVEAQSYEFDR